MNKKTLGVIGKGGLVKQLLNKISSEDKANAAKLDSYDLREMRNLFFENYDKIIFYNYGYKELLAPKKEDRKGLSFQEVCEKEFQNFGFDLNDFEKLGIKIDYCDNDENKCFGDGYNNFNDFFQTCDVIFDATGARAPSGKIDPNGDGKERFNDLFEDNRKFIEGGDYLDSLVHKLAENLIEGDDTNNSTNQMIDEFYEALCEDYTEKGKIIPKKENYVRDIKFAIETIETFANTFNDGSLSKPIGHRIYELVPFHVPIFLDRAEQIKKSAEKMVKLGKSLPVYIMAANEASIMSNIVSSICPEMTNRIVGLTSYDVDRSNESLNEEYNGILRRYDHQGKLKLKGVLGIHEKGFMQTLIVPLDGHEETFNNIFERANINLMIKSSTDLLESYYFRNLPRGRVLVNSAINKSAVELLVYSALSKDEPLEIHPPSVDYKDYLNNCFFNEDYGLFLNGIHQMRNGSAISNNFSIQLNSIYQGIYEGLLQNIRGVNNLLFFGNSSLVDKYFGIKLGPPKLASYKKNSKNLGVYPIYISHQKSIKKILT